MTVLTRLFLLCFFVLVVFALLGQSQTASGGGQAGTTSNTVTMSEHPQHADYAVPAAEKNLLQSGTITVASGEQPVSDFYTVPEPTVSLGQIAREYRTGQPVQRPIIRVIP